MARSVPAQSHANGAINYPKPSEKTTAYSNGTSIRSEKVISNGAALNAIPTTTSQQGEGGLDRV